MNSLDFLYFSLGGGFLILVGFICYMIYHLVEVVKSVQDVLENTRELTHDVMDLKDGVKRVISGFLGIKNYKLAKNR